ncbi:chromosome condensation regulator RCC1 [Psychrobacter sp. F1192]|uniref:Chromosome condensation regulator RCC1 n=1 Tax=Psychrobacter coccoides TaxID=2818440 RepID=A0ABS3NLK6_9GAMM|nr:chromosome condensation regulator RCC1 [Psychrobacter coccoides]MBO1530228.1 chromosome condensation regulator RCC1 [Psychrobacter coccoides]
MHLSRLGQALALSITALLLSACGDNDNGDIEISDVTPPLLITDHHFEDGYSSVAAVFIAGQVKDTGGIQSLTYQLNDEPEKSLTLDQEGFFSESILLALGTNQLTLTATDRSDNTTQSTKTIYVGDKVAAGGSHTGAIKDGQLYGWGRNNYGQTGLNMTTKLTDVSVHPATPALMSRAPNNLASISFNQNHSLAIDQKGQVYSWGEDKYGQLGRGDTGRHDCVRSDDCRLDIGAIADINNAVMTAAGYKHNLVLTKDGSVWAFGANGQGQLGNGLTTESSTPVQVDFSTLDAGHIVQVVASANSSYALDDKGQVWGWGSDAYANLGKGQECTSNHNCLNVHTKPIRIPVIQADDVAEGHTEVVIQLAAGRDHVLALTNNNSVYGWGLNASSQVGYNGENFSDTEQAWDRIVTTPTKLPWFVDKEVRRIYANGNASYALLNNGKVYPWGMFGETNSAGKTIYNDLDEPTDKLTSLTAVDNMAMGAMHLIAHEKPDTQNPDGNLFTWGWSFEGSLGSADAAHIWMYNTPIPISLPN